MPERNRPELLDEVVDAILAGRTPASLDPDVAMLAAVAADLRDLPDPAFKSSLEKRLFPEKEEAMPTLTLPHLKPYLVVKGADREIEFLKNAFDAELVGRYAAPDGRVMHAELRIGDSTVEMGEPESASQALQLAIHLYVDNVDEVYAQAIAAGADALRPVVDQFYGDREGTVRDPLGNHWYIATNIESGTKREGFRSITPFIHVRGTDRLIDWMKRALGAEEKGRYVGPDGLVMHAMMQLGESLVEMGEHAGEWKPMAGHIHLYVPDADAVYEQAIAAGATVSYPINNAPYGERVGGVTDPFGNTWYIATPL